MRVTPMVIRWVALAALVAGATFVSPVDGAVAVGETCHDLAATAVGAPGAELHGTPGPDVLVTNGASDVFAGAGNDVVCVTGGSALPDQGHVNVYGEDGDDVIDASASQAERTDADLGLGSDTYFGGAGADFVGATESYADSTGDGTDVVATGDGPDLVLTGGSPSSPDHDLIDLGAGNDDVLLEGAVDPAQPVTGGAGSDLLEFARSTLRRALVIDNAAGHATAAGVPIITWSGMEQFRIGHIGPYEPPSFIGGPGPERVEAFVPLTSVDLGGGDDVVNLELQDALVDHASYAGGGGRDAFILYSGAGDSARRVRLDLARGRLVFQRERKAVRARIGGFERHRFSARTIEFRGTRAADEVQWQGCHGVIDGARGSDRLEELSVDDIGCGYPHNTADLVVRGGPGNDTLLGGDDPNILLGGPGHDVADGRGNKADRCRAEVQRNCEL